MRLGLAMEAGFGDGATGFGDDVAGFCDDEAGFATVR